MGMSTSSGPLIADQPLGRRQRAGVIGFVNDGQSHAVLRDALSAYSSETIDLRRGDVRTATEVMARTESPDILIVDISGVSAPMQALSNLADVVEPGIQVLVIGDAVDVDFYRQVTRGLGVAEYIFKPISREMVGRYFGPLISRQAIPVEADRGGRMVAVIGARGGVGATTIAANLAWQFGVLSNRHTVLEGTVRDCRDTQRIAQSGKAWVEHHDTMVSKIEKIEMVQQSNRRDIYDDKIIP